MNRRRGLLKQSLGFGQALRLLQLLHQSLQRFQALDLSKMLIQALRRKPELDFKDCLQRLPDSLFHSDAFSSGNVRHGVFLLYRSHFFVDACFQLFGQRHDPIDKLIQRENGFAREVATI